MFSCLLTHTGSELLAHTEKKCTWNQQKWINVTPGPPWSTESLCEALCLPLAVQGWLSRLKALLMWWNIVGNGSRILVFVAYLFIYRMFFFFFAGMKRPYSPSALLNTELDGRRFSSGLDVQMDDETNSDGRAEVAVLDQHSLGLSLPSALHKPKREGKRRRYMLCEVCNIQLNSAAQAQVHYNGKSHQKRLKQISTGKVSSNTGR